MKRLFINRWIILILQMPLSVSCFGLNSFADSTRTDTTILLQDEIIVSALRLEESTFSLPQAISVIDNIQITRFAPTSLPNVLAEMPGVWIQKTNLGGGSPFIRGFTGYQVLMLIDGIRFNNSTFRSGPNQYLNTIDPLLVDKVEVLRGQGSVQYGTDAIGGAINILTQPLGFSPSGVVINGLVYGKYISHTMEETGRVSLNMANRSTAFQVGATYKNLGDIVAGGNLGTLYSTGYNEYSLDIKFRQRITSKQEITGVYQHHKQMNVPLYHKIVTGEYSIYKFEPQQRDLGYLQWKADLNTKAFKTISYTVSYQNSLEIRTKQKTVDPIKRLEKDEVQVVGNTIELVSIPSQNWVISSGVEYYHDAIKSSATELNDGSKEEIRSRGLYPDNSKANNMAVYVLNSFNVSRWNFSVGVRYNYIELKLKDDAFGDVKISPDAMVGNIGAVFKVNANHHLTASISSGFRAPNINDVSSLGEADFRYEVPNYELLPEKSLTLDMGWKIRSEHFSGNLHVYKNSLSDLITNVRSQYMGQDSVNNLQVYTRTNANKAVVYGVEADLRYMVSSRFNMHGTTTYTYGSNLSDNEPMRRIPPLFTVLGGTYDFTDRIQLFLNWKHAGAQNRLSQGDKDDDRIPEGGSKAWDVFNFGASYQNDWCALYLGLDNIFDIAYRTHGSGIDSPGRSLWVALKLSF